MSKPNYLYKLSMYKSKSLDITLTLGVVLNNLCLNFVGNSSEQVEPNERNKESSNRSAFKRNGGGVPPHP